jgi:hypothetical protein
MGASGGSLCGALTRSPLAAFLSRTSSLTDPQENSLWGNTATLCGHSLASRPTCDTFALHCLGAAGPDSQCSAATFAVTMEAGALDVYGLDYPTCTNSVAQQQTLVKYMRGKPLKAVADYDPCEQSEETVYLRRADVRAALHIPAASNVWSMCSTVLNYNQTDVLQPMQPIYTALLLSNPELRMVIFSGDDDSVCATLGTQHWMYNLSDERGGGS